MQPNPLLSRQSESDFNCCEFAASISTQRPTSKRTKFSHFKPNDAKFDGDGLRDFFDYRDIGIAPATNGQMVAHLVRANKPPEAGAGWHRHVAAFHIVIMTKGWARFI